MNKLTFVNGQGGIGAPAAGFDHYSMLVAYYKASAAVSGYSGIGSKIYTSVADAEADGVVNTFAECTASTSAQTVTATGADNDTTTPTFTDWLGNVITLGTYTKITADNTVTLVATGIVAAINALTYSHGFSATVGSSGAYTVTAPKKYGVYPNAKSLVNTIVGTIAITNVAFTGGTKSRLAIWHYQISEFFRKNPQGILWFAQKWDDSAQNLAAFNTQIKADIQAQQAAYGSGAAIGLARQIAVFSPERTFDTSTVDALQATKVLIDGNKMNAVFVYFGDVSGSTLTQIGAVNLGTLSDPGVSTLISQSGSGVGYDLFKTMSVNISSIGALLGTISAAAVSQDIAEVGAFNISDGTECETPMFTDSANTLFTSIMSSSLGDLLDNARYIYMGKFVNKVGTYFNDSHTAVSVANDFAWIERNRVVDKVKRGQYRDVLDLLNARIELNADGTISDNAVALFDIAARNEPDQLVKDGDLSACDIVINPLQNVVATGKVAITTKLLPEAIGRQITITEQYTAKL